MAGLAGATVLLRVARAQERVRRVGVLLSLGANEPQTQDNVSSFLQGLQQFGWNDGRNMRIDYRESLGSADNTRKYAA